MMGMMKMKRKMKRKRNKGPVVWAAGLGLVLAGGMLPAGGCNTGGGVPQMLEPTKPRMDRERRPIGPSRIPRRRSKASSGLGGWSRPRSPGPLF